MFGINGQRKRGLFGKAFDPTQYGTPGIGDGLRVEHTPQERVAQQPESQPDKPGFFDKGGASKYVFAGLQDFLQRRMGEQPTGVTNLLQQQQAEQRSAAEQAAAELKRAQELADWRWKEQWKIDNAPPPNNDTVNDFEWYRGLSDEEKRLYHQMRPQMVQIDNGDGTKTIVPFNPYSQQSATPAGGLPTFSDEDWEAAGSNAGGNFPR